MNWAEKKSWHVSEEVCKMIAWSLLRQKLLPGRLKVKWKQKQDCRVPEGLQETRASGLVSVPWTLWPWGRAHSTQQDQLIFLDKLRIESTDGHLWYSQCHKALSDLPSQLAVQKCCFTKLKILGFHGNQRLTNRLFTKKHNRKLLLIKASSPSSSFFLGMLSLRSEKFYILKHHLEPIENILSKSDCASGMLGEHSDLFPLKGWDI